MSQKNESRTRHIVCYSVAALICFASVAFAQSQPAQPAAAASQGGGDNGTDPSAFARRVALYHEFDRLNNGIDVNVVYLDLSFPVGKDKNEIPRGMLKVEWTFVEAQNNLNLLLPPGSPAAPGGVSGLGDIMFRVFSIPWYNEKRNFKALAGFDYYVPSAQGEVFLSNAVNALSSLSLGSGKYRIAPALGLVWAPRPNMLIAPVYWYDMAVAGDPERLNARIGKLRLFGMYAWPTGLYVLPEVQVVTNYTKLPAEINALTRRTEIFVRPEIGQVLSKDGTTAYIKPGFHARTIDELNRKWGFEGGLRLRF